MQQLYINLNYIKYILTRLLKLFSNYYLLFVRNIFFNLKVAFNKYTFSLILNYTKYISIRF